MPFHQKSYQKVLDYLENALMTGELSAGEKILPERKLAESLGISRNSVREAIRQLEHMGFLACNRGAGTFISCDIQQNLQDSFDLLILLHKISYRQLSELRTGLELQAGFLAAERITAEQLSLLLQIVQEMQTCSAARGDQLDKHLHDTIAEASGNELIIQILRALSGTIDRFISDMRKKIFQDSETANQLQYAHEQIVDALSRRDKVQLSLAITHHFNIVNASMYADTEEPKAAVSPQK